MNYIINFKKRIIQESKRNNLCRNWYDHSTGQLNVRDTKMFKPFDFVTPFLKSSSKNLDGNADADVNYSIIYNCEKNWK